MGHLTSVVVKGPTGCQSNRPDLNYQRILFNLTMQWITAGQQNILILIRIYCIEYIS